MPRPDLILDRARGLFAELELAKASVRRIEADLDELQREYETSMRLKFRIRPEQFKQVVFAE